MTPEEQARLDAEAKAKAEAEKAKADELLKNLNLKPEQIEALKANKDLLEVIQHQVQAKRDANNEAKSYREKVEAIEAERKAKEEEALKKKGDFETLLKQKEENEKKSTEKMRTLLIQKELAGLSAQHGLKNSDYLKMMDISDVKVDLDNLTVDGLASKFEKFKEKYPDFFGKAGDVNVDNRKPTGGNGGLDSEDKELEALRKKAETSRLPRDLAAYRAKKLEIEAARRK